MANDLRRKTTDILALHALTIEMAEPAVAWGWAMVDGERYSDGIWALTALTPPYHWSEISDLVGQIAREQGLHGPSTQDEATHRLNIRVSWQAEESVKKKKALSVKAGADK